MIALRVSKEKELKLFADMELQSHAAKFVNKTDLKTHRNRFNEPNTLYLTIESSKAKCLDILY